MSDIVNRVANSPLVTLDLENFYRKENRILFDLKNFLFQGLVIKEKEFRAGLKSYNWGELKGSLVAVTCTVDAIIPNWAFMLVGTYLGKENIEYVIGDLNDLEQYLFQRELDKVNAEDFLDKPVVIKGCSKYPVPLFAYGAVLSKLQPVARSIMYGEPCSTVPLYKAVKK
ncbi:DUF2480 family protein [Arthrospiribacter ruber]|uniref:DUF2480 family protein n=1 Tax=Arthrospiribacter ruber TaxID=2487934 RepID=A0A951J627_9BACT|nr:DUF2480 family protein [Arthrospiribacter ruber]MBW3470148.1 DUF2480 family protein [Arthrospiribacter ruber]